MAYGNIWRTKNKRAIVFIIHIAIQNQQPYDTIIVASIYTTCDITW